MVKQVIVVRTDLRNSEGHKIRTGKIAAQVAHASMKVFFDRMGYFRDCQFSNNDQMYDRYFQGEIKMTPEMYEWFKGAFTKICVSVDSEQELLEIYTKAKEANLPCALITDSGSTEFNGVPTNTCIAIGPSNVEDIDKITGGLKLL